MTTNGIALSLSPTRRVGLVLSGRNGTLTIGAATLALDVLLSPIYRGAKGDQGDPGPGAGPIQTLIGPAADPVNGHAVVGLDDSGRYRLVSNATAADAFRVAGITTGAAASGSPVTVQTAGPLVEPTWSWTPDLPVYVGAGGALTQTVPTSAAGAAFVMVLGVALTATSVAVRINQPIYL